MKRFVLMINLIIMAMMLIHCVEDEDLDGGNSDLQGLLMINEIYSTGSPDWIELYNSGDNAIDLSSFLISDDGTKTDPYPLPEETTIPANGYLVLLCDDSGVGLNPHFKLSSDGETIYLADANGNSIEEVLFPALNDGESYGRSSDGSDNWQILTTPTQGASNGGVSSNTPPIIDDVQHSPLSPTPDDDVTITATITDDHEIQSASLFYKVDQGEYNEIAMSNQGSNQYEAVIPAQADQASVSYYLEATDNENETTKVPTGVYYGYTVSSEIYTPPAVFINEFLAKNDTCCPDENSDYDDWIELYNDEDTAVDVGGLYITDDLSEPTMWQIPTSESDLTTIPPHGFLILWADKESEQGVLHVEIKLSTDGEQIGLFSPHGIVIDSLSFGEQTPDVSYGRLPDGDNNWQSFSIPTPGSTNQ